MWRYPFSVICLLAALAWFYRMATREREDWQPDRMSTNWRERQ